MSSTQSNATAATFYCALCEEEPVDAKGEVCPACWRAERGRIAGYAAATLAQLDAALMAVRRAGFTPDQVRAAVDMRLDDPDREPDGWHTPPLGQLVFAPWQDHRNDEIAVPGWADDPRAES